uniref:TNFR-Cys domain-containing protein n=2 Tax=Branchiostoma floridae TaxID=7739 RepID=C3Z9B3_BRAFL|eukprot:XP_002594831.1 hypothetical protein BRAFLDRAFT_85997 [Branchiostoma floridae]
MHILAVVMAVLNVLVATRRGRASDDVTDESSGQATGAWTYWGEANGNRLYSSESEHSCGYMVVVPREEAQTCPSVAPEWHDVWSRDEPDSSRKSLVENKGRQQREVQMFAADDESLEHEVTEYRRRHSGRHGRHDDYNDRTREQPNIDGDYSDVDDSDDDEDSEADQFNFSSEEYTENKHVFSGSGESERIHSRRNVDTIDSLREQRQIRVNQTLRVLILENELLKERIHAKALEMQLLDGRLQAEFHRAEEQIPADGQGDGSRAGRWERYAGPQEARGRTRKEPLWQKDTVGVLWTGAKAERLSNTIFRQRAEIQAKQAKISKQQEKLTNMIQEAVTQAQLLAHSDVCNECTNTEYCHIMRDDAACVPCSVCPKGYVTKSQCTQTTDVICKDEDECATRPPVCPTHTMCLNLPGSFLCVAPIKLCPSGNFFNTQTHKCQREVSSGPAVQLRMLPSNHINDSSFSEPLEKTMVQTGESGFVWADYTYPLPYPCKGHMELSLQLGGTYFQSSWLHVGRAVPREGSTRRVSGEAQEGASITAAGRVGAGAPISLRLRDRHGLCPPVMLRRQAMYLRGRNDREMTSFEAPLTSSSVLWLAHATGAVLLTARAKELVQRTGKTEWRLEFKLSTVSDSYILKVVYGDVAVSVGGNVKLSFTQAVYLRGSCLNAGISVSLMIRRDKQDLVADKQFVGGIRGEYMSIQVQSHFPIQSSDRIFVVVQAAKRCDVHFYNAMHGLSALNVLWIPNKHSSVLKARLEHARALAGLAQSTRLRFEEELNTRPRDVTLLPDGVLSFHTAGRVSMECHLRMLHSCDYAAITVFYRGLAIRDTQPVLRQVQGNTLSRWAGMTVAGTVPVEAGSKIHFELSCKRGRVNGVDREFAGLSLVWLPP